MPKKKTPGPAVERLLLADIKNHYPELKNEEPDVEFSKVGDPCSGIITFFVQGRGLLKAFFDFYPTKPEFRLSVYKDWKDDEQK
ncbi:hypothetical protein [Pseudomonas tolaasii]|uniref:hypothetical protein n=1 Tax=Pseudomonas tolaasii TaxID=29442 RepID=UPI0027350356|nr:hypothetical protein [Pseudomonas tolaasii]WLH49739.1 hypothetical protein PSH62_16725 [Pseudomonas tolaasii]